ncbi:hypothetical protein F511_16975 [Dorcoceras hygrometricum]|uniref:Uncharacterized protein n=1 Tax=Dorcoceras hygrometricum TaxID=472368 RepID=A0A2Z7AEX1_9LAMI|nr:hypothetical protein F511_16975 [Dorcoceras hygrometricum]
MSVSSWHFRRCVVLRNSSNDDVVGSSRGDTCVVLGTSRWVKLRRFGNSAVGVFPLVAIICCVMRRRLHLVETQQLGIASGTSFKDLLRYFLQLLDARASSDSALSSPCWDLLAPMRRVVNYHSS